MFKFNKNKYSSLVAPVDGICIPLEEVKDPVFSQKIMGDGFAMIPYNSLVCSPVDGEIILIADTLHAFGIRLKDGLEILVHIGLDSVTLKGKGFSLLQIIGTKVQKGTPIIAFDNAIMKQYNIDMTILVIVTNNKNIDIKDLKVGQLSTSETAIEYSY